MKANRVPLNNKTSKAKQRIQESLVNFICEGKSGSKLMSSQSSPKRQSALFKRIVVSEPHSVGM